MPETAKTQEWATAPKDGRPFQAQFSHDIATVKWNHKINECQIKWKSGAWVSVNYDRGGAVPRAWWRQ